MNLQTQCTSSPTDNDSVNHKKPFRSELNLVLSYPGNQIDQQSSPSFFGEVNTPPLPTPMELLNPLTSHPIYLQNLPSPFPSPIPSSPLTPPTNFKTTDLHLFENTPDYTNPSTNSPLSIFETNNSIFCTVSAPSTPASDRKCIDKFCVNENNDLTKPNDKKKAKRVSIFNTSKDEASEKCSETQDVCNETTKEGDGKDKKHTEGNTANNSHHGHRNHSHGHIHPKRRMSLSSLDVVS
jgi:hypothetical protein